MAGRGILNNGVPGIEHYLDNDDQEELPPEPKRMMSKSPADSAEDFIRERCDKI